MSSIEFIYNGTITTILCNPNSIMKEQIQKFAEKSELNVKDIYCLYDGQKIDEKLTFFELANINDQNRNKMSIVVIDNNQSNEISLKKSKYVICPICNKDINIKIQNYKINLYDCENNHTKQNLSLQEYEDAQILNESKIKCEICKNADKNKTYNNIFNYCISCKINLCPLCKNSHNKNHIIIDYDQKRFICELHNELFNSYCSTCKKNLCLLCEEEHDKHEKQSFSKIIPNKNNLEKTKNNLKIAVEKLENDINNKIQKLNKLIVDIKLFYKIYEDIIDNYEIKNRNFIILRNINYINNYQEAFIDNLNKIINDDYISKTFDNIISLYSQIFEMNQNKFDEQIKGIKAQNIEILVSKGLSKSEEDIITNCFLQSYLKYNDNFDQMDLFLEQQFDEKFSTWEYTYSLYRNNEGASFGYDIGKFFKIKINDVIFKIWITGEKNENL